MVVIIDQITKFVIKNNMQEKESIPLISDILWLTFIKNPGMAFGIQIGGKLFYSVFISLACLIIIVFLVRLKPENFWTRFALASILGGAIGNLIDRLFYGKVVDFIDIKIINWPVFNFADMAVTCGMIILIVIVIFERDKEQSEEGEQLEAS